MVGCPTLDGEAGESMLCEHRAGIAEFIRVSGRCQSSLSDFGLFRFQVEESPDKADCRRRKEMENRQRVPSPLMLSCGLPAVDEFNRGPLGGRLVFGF